MLEVATEEETVARIAGMPFERFLALLDEATPADLHALYSRAVDRYLVLSGKGRRTEAEEVERDRIDSLLRSLLGEQGLLAFAALLRRVQAAAERGMLLYLRPAPPAPAIFETRCALNAAAATCAERLVRTPIPLDAGRLEQLLRRAEEATAALGAIDERDTWWARLTDGPGLAAFASTQLLGQLLRHQADDRSYQALATLLDPRRCDARQRVERARLCHRVGGLLACSTTLRETGETFRQVAELVREGLGAVETIHLTNRAAPGRDQRRN